MLWPCLLFDTVQPKGTEEKQGLAALAFAEVLTMAEDNQKSVAISLYEVFQDHVYDLLDPTRSEVQVFEDSLGKIKLKGLSQASHLVPFCSYIYRRSAKLS